VLNVWRAAALGARIHAWLLTRRGLAEHARCAAAAAAADAGGSDGGGAACARRRGSIKPRGGAVQVDSIKTRVESAPDFSA